MSNLFISEFSGLAETTQGDSVPVAGAFVTDQAILIGVAIASAPFSATTKFIEIEASAICSFAIGAPGTVATVNNMRLNAGDRVMRGVVPGQVLSVITST